MVNVISAKVARSEELYERNNCSGTALFLARRYWLAYKLTGEQSCLVKAYTTVSDAFEPDFCNVRLYFACVFYNLELGYTDRAKSLLNDIKALKNYFKANEPRSYVLYLYFETRLEISRHKSRAAAKTYDAIEKYKAEHYEKGGKDEKGRQEADLLLGLLNIQLAEPSDAYRYLEAAFNGGSRSPFLYAALNDYYKMANGSSRHGENLLLPFINWGVAQGLDLSIMLNKWQPSLVHALNRETAERIYKIYPFEWLLKLICNYLVAGGDVSQSAFYYYKEAEMKQMTYPPLNNLLVRAAHKNGIEDISRYSLEQYLKYGDMDADIKAFVYHMLLTDDKYDDLVTQNLDKIKMFGLYCLANDKDGRYYYSVYKFILELEDEGIVDEPDLVLVAEHIIKDVLFDYEIKIANKKIKHIWIFEKNKRQAKSYAVVNGYVRITSCDDGFTYSFFGENLRHMLSVRPHEISIARLVKNADVKLYERYMRTEPDQTEILVNMAEHYMAMSDMPEECEPVLEKAVADITVSNSFRMRAAAALGNYYTDRGQYEKAVDYYEGVDENCLDVKDVERMLQVFVHTKRFERAVNLIIKKSERIADGSMFSALKQLALHGDYNGVIANLAYGLIMKGWYDKVLTDVVIKNFTGSQEQWQELSSALSSMSVSERSLNEIILSNAIYIHKIDRSTQKIFAAMFAEDIGNGLVLDAAMYIAYEIITNGLKPEYEAIEALEKLYLEKRDSFLAYALCHLYIDNNVSTLNSEGILNEAIELCARDGFIFPVFKRIKDKKALTPYIEKNTPFIYRGHLENQVELYYKFGDAAEYASKKMRYIRFGLFYTEVTQFYGETLQYYFAEHAKGGSTLTKAERVENTNIRLNDGSTDDYYVINNAIICEQMFKYEMVEEIITKRLAEAPAIKGTLL